MWEVIYSKLFDRQLFRYVVDSCLRDLSEKVVCRRKKKEFYINEIGK